MTMKIALVLLVVASCIVRLSVGYQAMDMMKKGIDPERKIAQLPADPKIEDSMASLGRTAGEHDRDDIIFQLINYIGEIYEDLRYNYMGKVKIDTSKLLAKMYGSSNKEIADALYKFLLQKYEWREWVVVVFNDVENKMIKLATNAFQITLHGKHVIVAGSTKDLEIDMDYVKYMLINIPYEEIRDVHWLDTIYLFYRIPISIRDPDSNYTVGVVTSDGSDLVVRGPSDRYVLVYKVTKKIPWYTYGRPWMFVLFTDKDVRLTPKRDDRPDPKADAIEAHKGDEQAHKD